MLIWIKAPFAAIGIFTVFVLLGVSFSEGNPITNISEETTTLFTVDVNDSQGLKIRDLPFSRHISNPCDSTLNIERSRKRRNFLGFYGFVSQYSRQWKEEAQVIMENFTIRDCETLRPPNLTNITLHELERMDPLEVLKKIHYSLLTLSAHAYFVYHQYSLRATCLNTEYEDRERNFAIETFDLAKKQRYMACMTQIIIEKQGATPNDIDGILEKRFTNLSTCSQTALRDCKTMYSIVQLLDVIEKYSTNALNLNY